MQNNHINYIEFKAKDLTVAKKFYENCFGWEFKDYGEDYCSFKDSGVFGGFVKTDVEIVNGVLVVLYHNDLESIRDTVTKNGGKICVDIFEFPGGKRFQFLDPSGNELAIWSE